MNKFISSVILFWGIIGSCGEHSEHQHTDNETAPISYTLYTEKTEVFVEFKPLVLNQLSSFAAHFTVLGENFLPLEKAKVTVSLIVGDQGIRATSAAPAVPGIFRLALSPTVAGSGKLIFDIVTPEYTDQVIIENVKVYADEKTALADQPDKKIDGGAVVFLKEQAWKIEFANVAVRKQPFHEVIKTSGKILPAPGDEVIITAASDGIVLFSGKNSIVGSALDKGEAVFIISGAGLTENNIDAKFIEAKSNYEKAKTDYERAKELAKDQIISQKELLEKQNQFETTRSVFNSVAQNYTQNGTRINTPISGFLKNLYITEGQFVRIGEPLASVSQNRKINLQAEISQQYYPQLATITSANFTTPDSKTYNTSALNGRMVAYGKSISEHNAFVPITFEIDNRGEILPGSYVDVYLKSYPIADALVIPNTALIEEQGLYFVYVQLEGERFTKRQVRLGAQDGTNVQILSGLAEGERVVTKGALSIKLSAASGALPAHGHEH